jgi:DNA-binding transcriptional LysR family regulator
MIAVRVSPDIRIVTVASPAYLAQHGTPQRPQDLRDHNCIRFRFPAGGLMPWRFEKKGKRVEVAVEGSVITSDPRLGVSVAADGGGIFHTAELYARELLAERRLTAILEDWSPAPNAFYLYYPSRRQNPAALQALIEFLKANLRDGGGGRVSRSERRAK